MGLVFKRTIVLFSLVVAFLIAGFTAATVGAPDVKQFAQADFPTRTVYGATDDPELRLITCGGAHDHAVGRYQDNVVVFAELAR